MSDATPLRLAVLGSPIAHSLSPQLHAAAYEELGLDWRYDRIEVDDAGLDDFLGGLGTEWRGLSLTMPLKRRVAELVPEVDPVAARTHQGNTILLDHGTPVRAFNTDVHGIVAALADAGVQTARSAVVLGGGATAESAVVALEQLGAEIAVAVRDTAKVSGSRGFASTPRIVALDAADDVIAAADVVVSTIPPRAEFHVVLPAENISGVLLDVAYTPWPTPLASRWAAAGGGIVHGLEMLLHQAVHQVRIFVSGDPTMPLPDEEAVIRAMRAAVE
ncbi:shikimate dehydrogenase [Homoserinibacter sp. GY 40078]|uniref:shikimate dehydrogenase n=1 Tax=Homoserinibacter sp. GY 40078 TaxID=2603275 RepID=UPI0011CCBCF3|nr:shikimate dehydrogenase [Homoserinibacter sp. GY 40078]TXK17534.1 shikimate dehydrogenase [Homoserinibacter sp. GY 40078]